MLRFFKVEDRTLKRHISIGVFVMYIETGSSVPGVPSNSRDLADENNKILIRNNRIAPIQQNEQSPLSLTRRTQS